MDFSRYYKHICFFLVQIVFYRIIFCLTVKCIAKCNKIDTLISIAKRFGCQFTFQFYYFIMNKSVLFVSIYANPAQSKERSGGAINLPPDIRG